MDENKNNEAQNNVNQKNETQSNEKDLKKETIETFKAAKEHIKNIDFKGEVKTGKDLFKKLWSDPVNAIKEISTDKENKLFKTSIILLVIWLILVIIGRIIYYAQNEYVDFEFLDAFKIFLEPILGVVAMVAAIYLINKKSKKSIMTTTTAVIIARVPLIISELISFLIYIGNNASYVTSPISKLLNIITIVLTYFVVKSSAEEEDNNKAFKLFVLVEAVYVLIYFVLRFLGIYIA